jgi:hypothetical protein
MTPTKRRRVLRMVIVSSALLIAVVTVKFLFLGQSLPAMLLARKPGTLDSGTVLLRNAGQSSIPPLSVEATDLNKITFDKLGGWKFKEGKTPIPEDVQKLDGKWVELSGYMYSNNQTQRLTRFVLVQSLWSCCFGRSPDLNHFVDVTTEPGKDVLMYGNQVKIIGKLSVGEFREGAYLISLYRLQANSIVVR